MAMSTTTATGKVSQITAKRIHFTAFQALWIPGTTRICSLGSNDGGFGVIQVHALSSASAAPLSAKSTSPSSSTTTTTTSSSDTATTPLRSPKLTIQSETEKKIQFKSGTFRASARSSSLPHLLTGDFEGRVGLWDLSRTEVPLSMFKAHEDVVNCIDGAGSVTGRPEFVTGGHDGIVKLWDMRQNHKEDVGGAPSPISNMSPKRGHGGNDVWCIAMGGSGSGSGSDDLMVAIGYDNGDVRVMDIRLRQAVFETNVKHGVCAVEFDRREGKAGSLVATTVEGTLHSFDLVNGQFATSNSTTEEVIAVQSGDDSTLWQARHIPQRPDIFAVTDGGGNIHM
ncbi:hypothetical protein BGZ58_001936 [Dissophora ornata]|nr:hypothetical protein BGZ58_001936 [Dissophora ornata]